MSVRALIVSVILVSMLLVIAAASYYLPGDRASVLARHASAIVATCKDVAYPPACYDEEIPRLMSQGLSMEEAFTVTRLIQDTVPDYFYCHVLGHRLAELETAKDISQWTSVVARCPTGMCSNGCIHGAAQERFRAESLSPEEIEVALPALAQTCSSDGIRPFTGVEQGSCYHSLGHLAMFITDGKTNDALAVCDAIAPVDDDAVTLCREGVFMQIFQPLEPEDEALVRDFAPSSATEARSYCDAFSGDSREACYRESWPLQRSLFETAQGVDTFCTFATSAESVKRCYASAFYIVVPELEFDEARIVSFCDGFDEKRRAQCYASAAGRMLETDDRLLSNAVRMCAVAESKGVGMRCYVELLVYSSNGFAPESDGFYTFCAALPEPWSERCMSGLGSRVETEALDL